MLAVRLPEKLERKLDDLAYPSGELHCSKILK